MYIKWYFSIFMLERRQIKKAKVKQQKNMEKKLNKKYLANKETGKQLR